MSTLFAQNRPKIKKMSLSSSPFTEVLAEIPDPPKSLYVLGKLPKERLPSVAIVGSRKPTSYGREVTNRIAEALATRGVVIISGLALGTDAVAHQAAIKAGGITIAVQANGLHSLYPKSNRHIGETIIKSGGAIVSEYPPGTEPMKHQFRARNRIVSGLADAIIITEAAARSGTLITAAHALEQGKDVYAVPGNITSPMSMGCNRLIAQGARPITDIDEFIDEIAPADSDSSQQILPLGDGELENAIIDLLANGMRDGDEILAKLNIEAHEFSSAMTMLEIKGAIKPLGSNRWSLR
jgi:DNA processing protein